MAIITALCNYKMISIPRSFTRVSFLLWLKSQPINAANNIVYTMH